MADSAVVTDKSLQLKVLGGIALASILIFGIVQPFIETSTFRYATIAVLGAVLLLIVALAVEL